MTAYVIFETKALQDKEQLEKYKELAVPSITQYGGKFLIGPGKTRVIEGDHVDYVVCLTFDTFEQAETWYESPEYQAAKKLREGIADVNALIVEGM